MVLLKSVSSAGNFWQLTRIEELIVSWNVVTINSQCKPSRLRSVIQHLVQLEILANVRETQSETIVEASICSHQAAAVAG